MTETARLEARTNNSSYLPMSTSLQNRRKRRGFAILRHHSTTWLVQVFADQLFCMRNGVVNLKIGFAVAGNSYAVDYAQMHKIHRSNDGAAQPHGKMIHTKNLRGRYTHKELTRSIYATIHSKEVESRVESG
ncbi:hypothetical protein HBI70_023410 [Parastagonospora nodorum]|nr:hypothetical protein HBH49_119520 [Parastagonospora nodorum]KAH4863519.1 hypothetical protein HBH75_010840 [Parastagonospora nodorum]KAH5038720.1 hypothetical protein HBI74_046200 [Parastagonospora nodorum]KAH5286157.1 hypothetical protein HBI70_023410 [Parastagonospora nodorum]KAH5320576.1 hypothetical protein HBI11_045290 [Parastagonospora nodorum]